MIIPPAEDIEGAMDTVCDKDTVYPSANELVIQDELEELDAFGPGRADTVKAKIAKFPSKDGLTQDFQAGYVLGLQTARTMLVFSIQLVKAGIKPEDIL